MRKDYANVQNTIAAIHFLIMRTIIEFCCRMKCTLKAYSWEIVAMIKHPDSLNTSEYLCPYPILV
jgi:hypothetical protein